MQERKLGVSGNFNTPIFRELDNDGNGTLSRGEATDLWDLATRFGEVDKNHNDQISLTEFLSMSDLD